MSAWCQSLQYFAWRGNRSTEWRPWSLQPIRHNRDAEDICGLLKHKEFISNEPFAFKAQRTSKKTGQKDDDSNRTRMPAAA